MPSEGRLPPRRRARRVVYKLLSDFLTDVLGGRVRYGDLREMARAADLWKHPKSVRFAKERGEEPRDEWVDVDELREAMREVSDELMKALHGRGAYGPRAGKSLPKRPAGARGRR